ncbi:MAG: carbamoyltransferase HypF [Bacteroidales bacterium]|nr:carbamoyltransferase HypF [Bacteroidales bacterium]
MELNHCKSADIITIRGRVQGVGFRPFVYRLAKQHEIHGWVRNTNAGVTIFCEGARQNLEAFLASLQVSAPVASVVESVSVEPASPCGHTGFHIMKSLDVSDDITDISPDIAVCDACLADMKVQPHRKDYPLINCTHCGPRFTIVKALPYDRSNTTMNTFPMCELCASEYAAILDRRFHAQPVACNACGPAYELWINGQRFSHSVKEILRYAADTIQQGGILAMKGVGGYHLVCNAGNDETIRLLRLRKGREAKPLAVMFRDIDHARDTVLISPLEEKLLLSWQRPIVLLTQRRNPVFPLSPSLNRGLDTLGVVLPYMPFHYLLMEEINLPAIVLTSGNLTGHPILTDTEEAIKTFQPITPVVISHQREIYNRIDDSVVRQIGGKERIFRRARGYCPEPVPVSLSVDGIMAMGGELVNTFCTGKGDRAYMSQYIGDLKNIDTQNFYRETIDRFLSLIRMEPELIVTDLHPEYFSTKWGRNLHARLTESGRIIHLEQVQHHHAHIVSCMAEHGLDERVIGVAFDGTGYGTDGHSWGSEFLVADLKTFSRISHFEYLMMPGGDKATEEPWRVAFSALYLAFGRKDIPTGLPLLNIISEEQSEWILQMLEQKVNTPLTSGAGRYFDAVAALLGLCLTSGYEGEGPMKLEAITQEGIAENYPVEIGQTISLVPAIRNIVTDLLEGIPPEVISTRFHNTIALAIIRQCKTIREETGLSHTVLSGGVFQNRYLTERLIKGLEMEKFHVYLQTKVPPNDSGLSLGQLVIAAKRRIYKKNRRPCV